MNSKERLAGHLLNLYWTGAGDAGRETTIPFFEGTIGVEESHVSSVTAALENGRATKIVVDGNQISLTDHFLNIAGKILRDLDEEKYRLAREDIKAGVTQGILDMLIIKGCAPEEIEKIKASLETPAANILLGMVVGSCPGLAGDLRVSKLIEGWMPPTSKP